jgi:DNA-binding NtrC family response regulator
LVGPSVGPSRCGRLRALRCPARSRPWHVGCLQRSMAHVLVAEDDPQMRWLVVEALRKDGHDVREIADGAGLLLEIAELFHRDPPTPAIDVVVSDVRMPLGNGREPFEKLIDPGGRVPFVLMTAFGDDDTRRRAERAGARLFDKPFNLDSLCAEVKRLADRAAK